MKYHQFNGINKIALIVHILWFMTFYDRAIFAYSLCPRDWLSPSWNALLLLVQAGNNLIRHKRTVLLPSLPVPAFADTVSDGALLQNRIGAKQ